MKTGRKGTPKHVHTVASIIPDTQTPRKTRPSEKARRTRRHVKKSQCGSMGNTILKTTWGSRKIEN